MQSINQHVIITDSQWKCSINALGILEVLVKGDEIDSQVLRDLGTHSLPLSLNKPAPNSSHE